MNIKQAINDVICYSQGIKDINVNDLYNKWEYNKRYFINKINRYSETKNSLIFESKENVTFTLGQHEQTIRFDEFYSSIIHLYRNSRIIDFLGRIKTEDFYNNLTSKEYKFPEITIPKGVKVLKQFKYFEQDENVIKDIQQRASMLIQENCVTGKFCISVHPLDYLSISENTLNWHSCHSLDGDYRAGNLEYMIDPTTVVCYLKSDKSAILPHFPESIPWNNKKWRCLLFFSNDKNLLFLGRQYPFESTVALDIIREYLTAAGLGPWSEFYNEYLIFNKGLFKRQRDFRKLIPINGELLSLHNIVVNNCGDETLYFNDILDSSFYTNPYYAYRTGFYNDHTTRNTEVRIGGKVFCPKCRDSQLTRTDSMLCEDCLRIENNYPVCDQCGEVLTDGQDRFFVGDSILCSRCVEKYCGVCENCEETFFLEDLIYDKKRDKYFCEDCYKELNEEVE